MYLYEELLDLAHENKRLKVKEVDFEGDCGYYSDECVLLSRESTFAKKTEILAEEIGHHDTTVGNIVGQSTVSDIKQEKRARIKGYSYVLPISRIVKALLNYCISLQDMSEYLGVGEEYICESLDYYKSKYGLYYECKDYTLFFEPLGVIGSCVSESNY